MSYIESTTPKIRNVGFSPGVAAGVKANIFFTEHYALSSGFFVEHTEGNLYFEEQTPFNIDYARDYVKAGATVTYKLKHINIPLGFELIFPSGENTYFVNTGVGCHFNIRATASDDLDYFRDVEIENEINSFVLSYHAFTGIYFPAGESLTLMAGIGYRHHFDSLTSGESSYNAFGHTISLRTGIVF